MQALRVVMLLVTVAICYLLFFHSQKTANQTADPLTADLAVVGTPSASPASAQTQYKEDMDRAHAAAKSMQDERKEADSY